MNETTALRDNLRSAGSTRETGAARPTDRVTLEIVLWSLVVIVALVLRLVNLGAAPLSPREARAATLAWQAAEGAGMPGADYSPLLFVGNLLLFTLLSPSDALARLWPVLFGCALTLVPYFFRRRIGRVGALLAGAYLALSPMALFTSRQLDGAVLVAFGAGVLLSGIVRFFDTGKRVWLALVSGGLALAVSASSAAVGMVLAGGLALLVFAWIWPGARVRWLWETVRPHVQYLLLLLVLLLLVFSTGLGVHLAGLGGVGSLLAAWFSGIGRGVSVAPVALLSFYEPLALFAALAGLVWSIRQRRRIGVLLGLWVGAGLFVSSLVPGEVPGELVWLVVPLALLGGLAVEALRRSKVVAKWRSLWPYAGITLALWVYCYIRATRYALYGDVNDLLLCVLAVAFPLLLLLLLAGLFMLTSGMQDREVYDEIVAGARNLAQGVVAGLYIALFIITVTVGWGGAQVRAADPREPLAHETTASEVQLLVQTLQDISWRETGAATSLQFIYEAPSDSVLTWYLRDFSAARRIDDVGDLPEEGLLSIVVTARREGDLGQVASGAFAGQDFPLQRQWAMQAVACRWGQSSVSGENQWPPDCRAFVRWLLVRQESVPAEVGRWAVLWVRRSSLHSR